MLLRFDPFRELDRMTEDLRPRPGRLMPMDAYRRGNHVVAHLDLPGVAPEDVDITVERNVLSITASRHIDRSEGDEMIVGERLDGEFHRQLLLGDTLDANSVEADVRDGVLTLRIPVAETAKPRKIEIGGGSRAIEGSATTDQPAATENADMAKDMAVSA